MTDSKLPNDRTTDDPAVIERDIRRTQDDMSRTVDRIGDRLTVKNVVNSLLDKADESGVDTEYLIDGARRNPMALGLIAAGAIWLVSDKNSKFPSLPGKSKSSGRDWNEDEHSDFDVHHRDYVAHMSAFEMREGEDAKAQQRRRDLHRANFLMCEQRPDEDEHSFRQRLDDMTESFREKRQAWSDSASETASATSRKARRVARQASDRAQDMYLGNPLVGGMLAAAVGAALGSTIPVSRMEEEQLGDIGARARDKASEQKDRIAEQAREKKDEMLDKADRKLQPKGQQQSGQPQPEFASSGGRSASGQRSPQANRTGGGERRSPAEGPFIMPDRKG